MADKKINVPFCKKNSTKFWKSSKFFMDVHARILVICRCLLLMAIALQVQIAYNYLGT